MQSSQELFSGHGWRLTLDTAELPNGKVKRAVRAHRPDSVHILALPTDSTVLILREYRPFYGQYIWMLPSGTVDKERNPEEAAQRELREETGHRADVIEKYFSTNHTEGIISQNHVYLARRLVKDPLPPEVYELMEVSELPLADALDRVLQSPRLHTLSAFALLRFMRERHL